MIQPFRFWAQKVLPSVYEDSLSYYEVLNKMSAKLNEVIKNVNNYDGSYSVQNIFNSVSDMLESKDLSEGMTVFTTGYYSDGDGGGSIFTITNTPADFLLDNGLYAKYIQSVFVTPEMFGGMAQFKDSLHVGMDNVTALSKAISYAAEHDCTVILTGKYYTSTLTIPESCAGVEIVGIAGNNNFAGIYSDYMHIIEQEAQRVSYKYMTIANIQNTTPVGGGITGVWLNTKVDDHMAYFDHVQFRYLGNGIELYGNSVEITNCHFSMCWRGITCYNGGLNPDATPYYSPYEFKSIIIENTRFHDCFTCVVTDETITPESNGNGITIRNCFADKCGIFYMGTCYNVIISDNYINCARRAYQEEGRYNPAIIYLESWVNENDDPLLPPTVVASANNGSFIANNVIKSSQRPADGNGFITIVKSTRNITVSNNNCAFAAYPFIVANDVQNLAVLNNVLFRNDIAITGVANGITVNGNVSVAGTAPTITVPTGARYGDNFGYNVVEV